MVSQTRIRCSQGLLPRRKSCSCFFLLISHPSMRVTEAVEGAKKRAELKASKPALGPQRGIARARERRGRRYCFTLLEPPDLATFTSPLMNVNAVLLAIHPSLSVTKHRQELPEDRRSRRQRELHVRESKTSCAIVPTLTTHRGPA